MANSALTKMIAGRSWKAKITPRLECGLPSSPNTNCGADVRVAQNAGDEIAQPAEQRLPGRNPQHEDREQQLEPQAPGDDPPADRAPVVRERHADGEDEYQADDAREPAPRRHRRRDRARRRRRDRRAGDRRRGRPSDGVAAGQRIGLAHRGPGRWSLHRRETAPGVAPGSPTRRRSLPPSWQRRGGPRAHLRLSSDPASACLAP